MPIRRPERVRRVAAWTAAAALLVVLSACAVPEPVETPTATVAPTESVAPSPPPEGPALHPEGSAADNLPIFTAITQQVWASKNKAKGRAYIDALTAAGFDKTVMQVTEDESTLGNKAESLQFSVQWGQECLIGQVGSATGDPVTVVMPAVEGGMCLIGKTRPIDW